MRWLFILLMLTSGALAQNRAALIADSIGVQGDTITATGNVQIAQGDAKLSARSLSYNAKTDALTVTGPLTLTDATSTIIVADFAQLSGDLRNGILRQARIVYNQQLQLAAAEIRRDKGRYTQLYNTVASSCHICERNPQPLWEIRAKRVVHDAEERQLYFENAQLRVMDVPVLYTPYLRLPDPSVERASGFLVPELRSNGDIGIGLRTPYFFTLGDHADLTLTPFLTTKNARTLEARYRQKFRYADIQIDGAVTKDRVRPGDLRSYLFAEGTFDLARGYKGKFDIELVSDPGYMLLYRYSEKDRLDSAISINRTRRNKFVGAELVHFNSLRDEDDNRLLPSIVAEAQMIERFTPRWLGGIATTSIEAFGLFRRASNDPTDMGLARDVVRASAAAQWHRDWLLGNGMVIGAETSLRADLYETRQDNRPQFGDTLEVTPYAALEWRWPMIRRGAGGVSHLLEPTAQLVWSDDSARDVANDDSVIVEFDEANLFRFSRFPGVDAQERGARINIGATYTRDTPKGGTTALTVGRVFRASDLNQFSPSSGLENKSSDWLIAAQWQIAGKLSLTNRTIINDELTISRNEMRFDWHGDDHNLTSTLAYLEADPAEGRSLDTSELAVDGDYQLTPYWNVSGNIRYDFINDRTSRAGLGLQWQNECAKVDFSVSRRFTSSRNIRAVTDFSLSVRLAGFGASMENRAAFTRRCNT